MDRTILHCDMNGFYASVELLSLPGLKGRPVAVCGNPDNRHGIILAKNEEAKACGIQTAETVWQAKKKCPNLVLVRPHHDRYHLYSKKINEIYGRFTDMVEPFSIDESWLDVTGSQKLFGSGRVIADRIRETVKKELGLTLSVGVSFNKVFAKMGSEYKKPDATTEITRENYKELIWTQPVGELFFVGGATAEKLIKSGIKTIGELAQANRVLLTSMLGKQGAVIHDYANGIDDSPVSLACERQKIKSVGNGMTFKRDLAGTEDIKTAILALADTVAGRLRRYEMKCQGVKVDIKDPLFKTISRQKQLELSTNLAEEIGNAAMELIRKSWNLKDPIRMLTVTGIGLTDEQESQQLSLFSINEENREKSEKMERTLDHIRAKYGDHAITFARILKNDIGIDLCEQREEEGLEE
ncbi:DNA polymerase IV [Sinanaerobacter chloroacetimidivorans]|uniref:DNA polymerase IV n=1 Tax=Sinanaerobacter chloroacetimidivorans TaxID=2818044 RepID=A0A8J7W3P7_9FIRM|nr:DNA polymerase IV [Sinanaerobacter chloroacetimidivorans]MBR0598798.1 DNA polymerase IV [Sinanaerobacter chloroacetimidivorans]